MDRKRTTPPRPVDLKDGKFHPLLEKETVTSIAIDHKPKWFNQNFRSF